ncbi:MAG TPA: ABC transporter substrate binding protein [Stellaceae bacterium]|nr:ABC transporter substrate binding protein [Stellaceae bacterium]
MYPWPDACRRGGLIGYGPNLVRIYGDQLSRIAAEILRGTKPADIPVERPTHFYLKMNQQTAAALGVTVPPLLLAQTDEVVE